MAMKWRWWRSSVVEVLKLKGRGKEEGKVRWETTGVASFNMGRGSDGEVAMGGNGRLNGLQAIDGWGG
jgi:hypothetical protein